VIPVDPRKIPKVRLPFSPLSSSLARRSQLPLPQIDDAKLVTFPYGYRHLGYCQSLLWHNVKMDLPTAEGEEHDRLYDAMRTWTDDEAGRTRMYELLGVQRA
jgi:hypothetical protein